MQQNYTQRYHQHCEDADEQVAANGTDADRRESDRNPPREHRSREREADNDAHEESTGDAVSVPEATAHGSSSPRSRINSSDDDGAVFRYARAGRSADVGRELERGRPFAERADASTAVGRAQRGTAREREGAFGNAAITAEVRYSLLSKHYRSRRLNGGERPVTARRRARRPHARAARFTSAPLAEPLCGDPTYPVTVAIYRSVRRVAA